MILERIKKGNEMKKLPLNMLSAEDRKTQLWREKKAAHARKVRKLRRDNLRLSEEMLVRAARAVVKCWPTNSLANAVNDLENALSVYGEVRK